MKLPAGIALRLGRTDESNLSDRVRQQLVLCRIGAGLFGGNGAVAAAAMVAGHDAGLASICLAAAAIAYAALIWGGYRRLTFALCQLTIAVGSAMVADLVFRTAPIYGLLDVSCVCALFLFPTRWMVVQGLWMVSLYGVAVAFSAPLDAAVEATALLAGTVVAVSCVVFSLRRQAAEAASRDRASRAILDALFEASPLGIALFDPELRYVRVNDAYAAWGSCTAAQHHGRRMSDIHPEVAGSVDEALRGVFASRQPNVGHENRVRGRWYRTTRYPVQGPDGEVLLVASVVDDITELREAEARLALLAATDPLTGLANRAALGEELDAALVRADEGNSTLAVVFVDLDGFKAVNDTFGHGAGDRVLQVVARRIKAELRQEDAVARVGGDEFVVLLTHVDPAQVVRRLQAAVRGPIGLVEGTVRISASFGVGTYPRDGSNASTLLSAADMRMYHAKRAGRSTTASVGL